MDIYSEIKKQVLVSIIWSALIIVVITLRMTNISLYEGVYNMDFMYGLLGAQIPLLLLNKRNNMKKKWLPALQICLIVLVLCIFEMTKPPIKYADGMRLIIENADYNFNYIGRGIENGRSTIPVKNANNMSFMRSNMYYYRASTEVQSYYYIVHPVTGEVVELDEAY